MTYQQLDSGIEVRPSIPLAVQEARIGAADGSLQLERESKAPTLAGVAVSSAHTVINERRTLVVSYNSTEPPGTLGYTVVVRPGYSVGDHYHHRREERIILLHGRVEFRLQDCRSGSPTSGLLNLFTLDYPGTCVRVPVGVAHAIIAEGDIAVLQVLASSDYDPSDDVHVSLSGL